MTTPTNIPISYSDIETGVFQNQLDPTSVISDNTYSSLIALLELRTSNKLAAENLAATLIQSATIRNIDIDEVIDALRRSANTEIDATLAYFLNLARVGTSYLGIIGQNLTNPYVQRTILP